MQKFPTFPGAKVGRALTTVLLIRAIPAVVNAVTLAADPQAHTLVLAAEWSVGGTLEFHCTNQQTETKG